MTQMVEMLVAELFGAPLDYAVALAERLDVRGMHRKQIVIGGNVLTRVFSPSTSWFDGGQLIESYGVAIRPITDVAWEAEEAITLCSSIGSTPLIAAMRAIAASHFGKSVQIPAELMKGDA